MFWLVVGAIAFCVHLAIGFFVIKPCVEFGIAMLTDEGERMTPWSSWWQPTVIVCFWLPLGIGLALLALCVSAYHKATEVAFQRTA